MAFTEAATAIASAISEGFKLIRQNLDTAESRRMRKAIDVAETYIHVNESDIPFDTISDESRRKLLRKYRKKFFAYNQ